MATFLRLSSCSSSAIVDMEKVVSISSGDLLYRELLRPNWSSFPDPDNLKNDHQFTKLLLPLKKMKKNFLLVKIYLLFWLFFRANFKLTNERSSFCFVLILNWEFDGNYLNIFFTISGSFFVLPWQKSCPILGQLFLILYFDCFVFRCVNQTICQ